MHAENGREFVPRKGVQRVLLFSTSDLSAHFTVCGRRCVRVPAGWRAQVGHNKDVFIQDLQEIRAKSFISVLNLVEVVVILIKVVDYSIV